MQDQDRLDVSSTIRVEETQSNHAIISKLNVSSVSHTKPPVGYYCFSKEAFILPIISFPTFRALSVVPDRLPSFKSEQSR